MGLNSGIAWTDHTANFWWGCVKVSEGCRDCYAETLANRYGKSIWGPAQTTDRELKKGIWKDILKWDEDARNRGVRERVFVQSMADFLEDHPQVYPWREKAKRILENLTNLDVLMLTKRPEDIPRFLPEWMDNWPAHIWAGTSTENQHQLDIRVPHLLKVPAAIRFLSVEPMIGPVDLTYNLGGGYVQRVNGELMPMNVNNKPIHWVITGGESGRRPRPYNLEWYRSIRDQCVSAGVPYFHKQHGGRKKINGEWGGRVLDGQIWDQFPVNELVAA